MALGSLTPEEKYFQEQEAELRRKLREEAERKAHDEHQKRALASGIGTDDASIVERLHRLGLDGDTARGLHLLPLVEIAWADGSVSQKEREAIVTVAAAHGIEPTSPAGRFLASLLEQRPSAALLDEILLVLHEILQARDLHPHSVLEACESVARASGGLLGLGNPISADEREVIEKIAASLSDDAAREVTQRLG